MTVRRDQSPGPFDIDRVGTVLGPDGHAHPRDITADFYAALDRDFDGFKGCALVSRHEFSHAWDMWEIHPAGDEIVYLLSGDADFVLWREGVEEVIRLHETNSYIVVPRDVWHTVRPRKQSAMLFITPGEGTRHAESPDKF